MPQLNLSGLDMSFTLTSQKPENMAYHRTASALLLLHRK